jgi:hypothetical protein
MDMIVLIIALLVSLLTLGMLIRLLREVNRGLDNDIVDGEQQIEDLEAQMERLENLGNEAT